MRLRKLLQKDAPLMLEWMHDKNVIKYMQADFAGKTLADCQRFIEASKDDYPDCHLAIADENDEYLGTVSLKHIDLQAKTAEFGICIRSCAMGKGFAKTAMAEIIETGFSEFGLKNIYWCVNKDNLRGRKFYDKEGYPQVTRENIERLANNYVHGGGAFNCCGTWWKNSSIFACRCHGEVSA